ncbi:hypothetical protein F4604DRAFT_1910128 [Suillus subluteus]|nr:hypothetical protein F4604DRAFT_1910128 [Suillus subluteus]
MSRAILYHGQASEFIVVLVTPTHSFICVESKGAMKLLKQKREDSMKHPMTLLALLTSSVPAIPAVVAAPINTKRFHPAATKNGRNLCAHRWLKQLMPNGSSQEFKVYWDSLEKTRQANYDIEASNLSKSSRSSPAARYISQAPGLASINVAISRLSIDGTRHLSTLIYGHPAVQIPSISVVLRARASDRFSLGMNHRVCPRLDKIVDLKQYASALQIIETTKPEKWTFYDRLPTLL